MSSPTKKKRKNIEECPPKEGKKFKNINPKNIYELNYSE